MNLQQPATAESPIADARCRRVIEAMHTHRGDPAADIERMLAVDPEAVAAHWLRVALAVQADDATARSALVHSLALIEAVHPIDADPMHRHAEAARAWLDGDPDAALERYGELVADHPRDIVALVLAHALDFRLGKRSLLRQRLARALRAWDATMPGYASVLAMYAFGLEEGGRYRRAERYAREALAFDPGHPSAIHALAHVLEMRGRASEGLALLAATEHHWIRGNAFSVHLAWHRGLFQLDAADPAAALATYDALIAAADPPTTAALADASALLWRLTLRNVDVAARWQVLADRWEAQPLSHARPFFAMHAMMAFAAARRRTLASRLMTMLPARPAARPEEAMAQPWCEALLAFSRGDYRTCIERLLRVRRVAHRCGGSIAQCDLIHLTFTEAALRAHDATLARTLVAQRTAWKPMSWLNRLLQRRARALAAA